MNRIFPLVLSITLLLCSCAHSASPGQGTLTQSAANTPGATASEPLAMTVTIPAELLGGMDPNIAISEAQAQGARDGTVNADGSITYRMAKADYDRLVQNKQTKMREIASAMASGLEYPSIKRIELNKDMTQATFTVDKALYEKSFDNFAVLALVTGACNFQALSGNRQYRVVVKYIDAMTGQEYKQEIYPEALNER